MSTPVLQLLDLVWKNTNEAKGHSWTRLNQSMRGALVLCMKSGFKFDIQDFRSAYREYRGGYWFGENTGEWFYSEACKASNKSAAIAFEAWRDRKPFLFEDELCEYPYGAGSSGGRIYVGLKFAWDGEYVTCTSIADDGLSLIACGYDAPDSAPKRKHRITHDDLKAVRQKLKSLVAAIKAIDHADPLPEGKALCAEIGVDFFLGKKFVDAWKSSTDGKRWTKERYDARYGVAG